MHLPRLLHFACWLFCLLTSTHASATFETITPPSEAPALSRAPDSRRHARQSIDMALLQDGTDEEVVDFALISLELMASPVYKNDRLILRAVVENRGNQTEFNLRVIVDFAGGLFSQGYTIADMLKPGQTAEVRAPYYHPPAGNYQISARLTVEGASGPDQNSDNDVRQIAFEVLNERRPGTNSDLILLNGRTERVNQQHHIGVDVKNQGTGPMFCDNSIGMLTVVTSGARQVMDRRGDYFLPAGDSFPVDHQKTVDIAIVDQDYGNVLQDGHYNVSLRTYSDCEELDLVNNVTRFSFTSGTPEPLVYDFAMDEMAFSENPAYINSHVELMLRVKNVADTIVDNPRISITLVAHRNGQLVGLFKGVAEQFGRVNPGDTCTLKTTTTTYYPSAGEYEVKAMLNDRVGGQPDADLTNNEMITRFTVKHERKPGTSSDLTFSGTQLITEGQARFIRATVKNQGTDPMSCGTGIDVRSTLTTGGIDVLDLKKPVLEPGVILPVGSSRTIDIPLQSENFASPLADGDYTVLLRLTHSQQTCEELDDSNNSTRMKFTIRNTPDLAFRKVEVDAETSTVTGHLINVGTASMICKSSIVIEMTVLENQREVYSRREEVLAPRQVLQAGQTRPFGPWTQTPRAGQYELRLKLTSRPQCEEGDLRNNGHWEPFTIRKALRPNERPAER